MLGLGAAPGLLLRGRALGFSASRASQAAQQEMVMLKQEKVLWFVLLLVLGALCWLCCPCKP